jgi:hypothetical protein
MVEICGNGVDDDCDGFADEGCAATAGRQACWTGPLEARGAGTCKDGVQMDVDGTWGPCAGEVLPGPEKCGDGLDSDCDGLGGSKEPEEPSCCTPSTEVCNGLDDDCDGEVDEGLLNRCGQCEGTGSCFGTSFEDMADCDRPGRTCTGIEAAPFDPALITLMPGGGASGGGGLDAIYAYGYTLNPFYYFIEQLDPTTAEPVWVHPIGTDWIHQFAVQADGSVWFAQLSSVTKLSPEGEVVCTADGMSYVVAMAADPSGDVWMVWGSTSTYHLQRFSGTDVIAEKSPGVPWPDGMPRCAPVDLDPDGEDTGITLSDSPTLVVDADGRLWLLASSIRVLENGAPREVLDGADFFYTSPKIAPDGSLLVGWPLRRLDLAGVEAGDASAIHTIGSYAYDLMMLQPVPDGSLFAMLNPFPSAPKIVHIDPLAATELERWDIPGGATGTVDNVAVDGSGMVWVGLDKTIYRLDPTSGQWDSFAPGGQRLAVASPTLGGGAARSTGKWTQLVDPGAWKVAWGKLSWEATSVKGQRVAASVRFADAPGALDGSKVVCGPSASPPLDLSVCSQGLRYARVELDLAGSGSPTAGHVAITWDRP